MNTSEVDSAQPERTAETRTSIYELRADGIIVQRVKAGIRQSLADAKENVAAMGSLAGDKKRPLLVDGRATFGMEPGVREYYAGREAMRQTAVLAMLSDSMATRIIFNAYMAISAPKVAMRMFTSEPEAIQWLLRMDELQRRTGRTP